MLIWVEYPLLPEHVEPDPAGRHRRRRRRSPSLPHREQRNGHAPALLRFHAGRRISLPGPLRTPRRPNAGMPRGAGFSADAYESRSPIRPQPGRRTQSAYSVPPGTIRACTTRRSGWAGRLWRSTGWNPGRWSLRRAACRRVHEPILRAAAPPA